MWQLLENKICQINEANEKHLESENEAIKPP